MRRLGAAARITWRSSSRSSARGSSPPMVDNDAGGIYTYSQAGARFGYHLLWTLIPITFLLVVTQEMCSRMGAVTGKGLSDLIREEYGLRTTFVVMTALVLANLTNVMAELRGHRQLARAVQCPATSRCPSAARGRVAAGGQGHLRARREGLPVRPTLLYIYVHRRGRAGRPRLEGRPPSTASCRAALRPRLRDADDRHGRHVGRAVDAVLPAGRHRREGHQREGLRRVAHRGHRRLRGDGRGRVLHHRGLRGRDRRRGAARHQRRRRRGAGPQAVRRYAYLFFAAGLFNASIFAACIQPLSTAYTVCEGLGFESGVNFRFREAPLFYWLFTLLVVVRRRRRAAARASRSCKTILWSQILNGILLPFVLIFMVLLVNKERHHEGVGQPADLQHRGVDSRSSS